MTMPVPAPTGISLGNDISVGMVTLGGGARRAYGTGAGPDEAESAAAFSAAVAAAAADTTDARRVRSTWLCSAEA